MNETPNVIVDCRFLPKLTNRALNLTANQMTFMHVENREKSWEFINFFSASSKSNFSIPWPLFFANLDDTSPRIEQLKKRREFWKLLKLWLIFRQLLTVSSLSNLSPAILPDLHAYRQMYPQKKMIYLSPHVEAELEKIEDDHVRKLLQFVSYVLIWSYNPWSFIKNMRLSKFRMIFRRT